MASEKELKWIHQIIEGKAEQDRILYQERNSETGFVITPDTKWDEVTIRNLYVLCMAENINLHSVRDLRKEHVPFLQHMRDTTLEVINKKYNIPTNQIIVHIHYIPSFMQFHIHFVHYARGVIGMPRAILLDDVIDNLNRDSYYYTKNNFTLVLPVNHPVIIKLKEDSKSLNS